MENTSQERPDSGTPTRQIALNTASRYASRAVAVGTQFVLTPFLIASIGKPQMGLATLAGQALQFVALASTAIGVGFNKFAATHHARGETDAMNVSLSGGLLLSLASAALYAGGTLLTAIFARDLFALPPGDVTVGRIVILLTGLAATLHISYSVWLTPIFVTQRFYIESVAQIVAYGGAAIGVWLAFKVSAPSIVTWVVLSAGFRIGSEVFYAIPRCRRAVPQMRIHLRHASWEHMRGMVQFSGLSFVAGLGYLLYFATDSIVISNLGELGPTRIVDYNVAQRWDPQIRFLIMAFVSVLTPAMTADVATGRIDRVREAFLRGLRYSLTMGLYPCMALGLLAAPFLRAWLGANLAPESVPVMQVIMAGFAVSIPGMVGYEALYALGRIGGAAVATCIGGVLNIALCVLLVKGAGLGLVGVGLAGSATLAAVNGFYIPWQVCRHTGLPVRDLLTRGWIPAAAGALPALPLCLWFACATPARDLPGVCLQFAAVALAYAPGVWFLSLDAEERRRLRTAAAAALDRIARRKAADGSSA